MKTITHVFIFFCEPEKISTYIDIMRNEQVMKLITFFSEMLDSAHYLVASWRHKDFQEEAHMVYILD